MQKLGIRPEVIEACQNHLPQGIKAVYQRHAYAEEKRHAFEALAAEVPGLSKAGKRSPTFVRGVKDILIMGLDRFGGVAI